MPKATAYTLAWSVTHQAYTLYDRHAEATLEFDETSLAWHAWLEQASSFAFRGQKGAYTARREQIKPGDWYWYAYQRSQKRVQKKYLGKSAAISLQRLEEVAASFNSEQAVEDETAISTRPVRMSNMAQERILATKLRVPLPSRHFIARPRLSAYFQRALESPITLLSAPAGSGKSTLVSSWLRESSGPSAWLSLDQADNDPLCFWSYLFTALDTLYPGTGEHALRVLRSARIPSVRARAGFADQLVEQWQICDEGRNVRNATRDRRLPCDHYRVHSPGNGLPYGTTAIAFASHHHLAS